MKQTFRQRAIGLFMPIVMLAAMLTSWNVISVSGAEETGTGPMVAAGSGHTLALKGDGTVWAWGSNSRGQLGDGTNTNSTTPAQVEGLTGIVYIAAGAEHSLAVKNDGTVWAWGYNFYGQLGNGVSGNDADKNTPVQMQGLNGVRSVAAGAGHTVILKNDGTVWTIGSNFYGQLGNKDSGYIRSALTSAPSADKNTLVQVSELSGVIDITAGSDFTVALKDDGTVWTWGRNTNGQLGDGALNHKNTPVQVSGLSDVKTVSARYAHTAALKSDGSVWAWGYNHYGQLGDGTTADRNVPVRVPTLSDTVSVTAGYGHSVALKNDGSTWAWGQNIYGQLGDNTSTGSRIPAQVKMASTQQAASFSAMETTYTAPNAQTGILYADWKTLDGNTPVDLTAYDPESLYLRFRLTLAADNPDDKDLSNAFSGGYVKLRSTDAENVPGDPESGNKEHNFGWRIDNFNLTLGDNYVEIPLADFILDRESEITTNKKGVIDWTQINRMICYIDTVRAATYPGVTFQMTLSEVRIVSLEPGEKEELENVIYAAAGYNHATVFDNSGLVMAWGRNINGQLGNDSNADVNGAVQSGLTLETGKVTVSFDSRGGDAIPGITATVGEPYGNLITPVKSDSVFEGWYNSSNEKIESSTIVSNPLNHTLHAVWKYVPPTSITLNKTSLNLKTGENETLTVNFAPADVTDKTVVWSTSNSSVATVSDGMVTAAGAGTATITANASGKTATCQVEVTSLLQSIRFEENEIFIIRGRSQTLNVIFDPVDVADKTLNWSSSNPDVVSVNGSGSTTAHKIGSAVITAEASDGKKAECTVYVYLPGDVNADGNINIFDIMEMRDHIFGKKTLAGIAFKAGNTDGNNAINIFDIMAVRNHIFGKTSLY